MLRRVIFHFVLCAALIYTVACKSAQPRTNEAGWVTRTGEAIEDSGRRLSGNYAVSSMTDEYRTSAVQATPRWSFSFKEDGSFQSERETGGAARVETGSYLISVQGALVLFVETVSGNALSDAHTESYQIEAQDDSELRLRRSGSTALVLRKK